MQQFLELLSTLGASIDAGVYNVVGIVGAVLVLFVISLVGKQIADNEFAQRLLAMWKAVEDEVVALVIQVAYGDVDLTAYEIEADELAEQDPPYIIEPRMLFVVRTIEAYLKNTYGYKGDFVVIHRRAEAIFQMLKSNSELPNV